MNCKSSEEIFGNMYESHEVLRCEKQPLPTKMSAILNSREYDILLFNKAKIQTSNLEVRTHTSFFSYIPIYLLFWLISFVSICKHFQDYPNYSICIIFLCFYPIRKWLYAVCECSMFTSFSSHKVGLLSLVALLS